MTTDVRLDRWAADRSADYKELVHDFWQITGHRFDPLLIMTGLSEELQNLRDASIDGTICVEISATVRSLVSKYFPGLQEESKVDEPYSPRVITIQDYISTLVKSLYEVSGGHIIVDFNQARPGGEPRNNSKLFINQIEALRPLLKVLRVDDEDKFDKFRGQHQKGNFDVAEWLKEGVDYRTVLRTLVPSCFEDPRNPEYWKNRVFLPADIAAFIALAAGKIDTANPIFLAASSLGAYELGRDEFDFVLRQDECLIPVLFRDKILLVDMNSQSKNDTHLSLNGCSWMVLDGSHESRMEEQLRLEQAHKAEEKAQARRADEAREVTRQEAERNTTHLRELGLDFLLTLGLPLGNVTNFLDNFDGSFGSEPLKTDVIPSNERMEEIHLIRYESPVDFQTVVKDLIIDTGYWEGDLDDLRLLIQRFDLRKESVVLVNGIKVDKNGLKFLTLNNGSFELSDKFKNTRVFKPGTVFVVKQKI